MSKTPDYRAVARMQLESCDRFMLFTQIGNQLHMAGDLDLINTATSFITQAQAHNMPLDELIQAFTDIARECYGQPDPSKIIPITGR